MKIKIVRFILLLIIVLTISCQSRQQLKDYNYSVGTLNDSVYTNKDFQIDFKIPNDWHVYPRAIYDSFYEAGKTPEEPENLILTFIMLSDKSISDSTIQRQTILINAERPINKLDYPSELVFLERTKEEMRRYQLPIRIFDKTDTVKVLGKEFISFHAELQTNNGKLYQDYMTFKQNDFFLNIALSYSDLAQRKKMIEILNKK